MKVNLILYHLTVPVHLPYQNPWSNCCGPVCLIYSSRCFLSKFCVLVCHLFILFSWYSSSTIKFSTIFLFPCIFFYFGALPSFILSMKSLLFLLEWFVIPIRIRGLKPKERLNLIFSFFYLKLVVYLFFPCCSFCSYEIRKSYHGFFPVHGFPHNSVSYFLYRF